MAVYKLTCTVDDARKSSVEKKLRQAFGEEVTIFSVEKNTGPGSRAERLLEAEGMVQEAIASVEELKDEMEQWRDSIPENLQGGDKYNEVDECCTALEELKDSLETCQFDNVSFPGMF